MTKQKNKPHWSTLSHDDRIHALRDNEPESLVADYTFDYASEADAIRHLHRERELWDVAQVRDGFTMLGKPPNKEVMLGAWRDLDRVEAVLELVDNSIDAWLRRKKQYPNKAAPELNIYIDIDSEVGRLTYEDNAGGVPTERLVNLVIPGYSETEAEFHSIGSYKTGGKKAIFRLAVAANITSRFWNPAETTDEAVSVHLDEQWLNDPDAYEFPYHKLKDKSQIQKGQTRYLMQLREEPRGAPWYDNTVEINRLQKEIRRIYSLLLVRNPEIKIYFPNKRDQIKPDFDGFHDLTDAFETGSNAFDVRPQLVRFEFKMGHRGREYPLQVEVLIGCRQGTGQAAGFGSGFDLYGNDRLFVQNDQKLLADRIGKGNSRNLLRGYVNVIGPNIFIPWDTHKRHLNFDRDIVEIIRQHPAIVQLIDNWKAAVEELAVTPKFTTLLRRSPAKLVGPRKADLIVKHSSRIVIDPLRKRKTEANKLPDDVFVPSVGKKKSTTDRGIQVTLTFTKDEARAIASAWGLSASVEDQAFKKAMGEKIRDEVMKRTKVGKAKKSS